MTCVYENAEKKPIALNSHLKNAFFMFAISSPLTVELPNYHVREGKMAQWIKAWHPELVAGTHMLEDNQLKQVFL